MLQCLLMKQWGAKKKEAKPSRVTQANPELFAFLHELMALEHPGFCFSHVTVNNNLVAIPHRDDRLNLGSSLSGGLRRGRAVNWGGARRGRRKECLGVAQRRPKQTHWNLAIQGGEHR
jgi:hypothetical protein